MLKQTSPNQLVALKLLDAQALIERGWCQVYVAQDAEGLSTFHSSPDAISFCAFGAMKRVSGGDIDTDTDPAWAALCDVCDGTPIDYNDTPGRTQAEVVAMFGRAAELAAAK